MGFSAVGSLFSDNLLVPFAFKNARIEWVDFCEALDIEPQEESSLSRFYNDVLRE